MFPPADGASWFAAGADALKSPPLRRFPLLACVAAAPSGVASPVGVRPVDVKPAFSKIVGVSKLGVKA